MKKRAMCILLCLAVLLSASVISVSAKSVQSSPTAVTQSIEEDAHDDTDKTSAETKKDRDLSFGSFADKIDELGDTIMEMFLFAVCGTTFYTLVLVCSPAFLLSLIVGL